MSMVMTVQGCRSRGVQSDVAAQPGDGVRSDSASLFVANARRSDTRAARLQRSSRSRRPVLAASHHPRTTRFRRPVL